MTLPRFRVRAAAAALAVLALVLPAEALPAGSRPRDDRERRLGERTKDAALEGRIDRLLAAMTLEEKVGQMTMVNIVEDVPDESKPYPDGFPALRPGRIEPASGGRVRQRLAFQQGIPTETARRLVAEVKKAKLKVQAAIQGDSVRISGKNKDDLQTAIAALRAIDADVPLAFTNYR